MATKRLSEKALYVDRGYGQVEPNHLSAQRTGQIYAQLPANAEIDLLENGQFVKYNYAAGEVDFVGKGEWMLVYNEVKVYYDHQGDHDFAMKKENYNARVYAPVDAASRVVGEDGKLPVSRDYSEFAQAGIAVDGTNRPFEVETFTGPKMMPEGSTMVPRVFKTNVGDIFTTNTIAAETLEVGDTLAPGADGYLAVTEATDGMLWEVVKVYTMPDRQKGVKIVRIA